MMADPNTPPDPLAPAKLSVATMKEAHTAMKVGERNPVALALSVCSELPPSPPASYPLSPAFFLLSLWCLIPALLCSSQLHGATNQGGRVPIQCIVCR